MECTLSVCNNIVGAEVCHSDFENGMRYYYATASGVVCRR
jgi:hypothetical protein